MDAVWPGLETKIYYTPGEYGNDYNMDAVFLIEYCRSWS
jgi:hypothetical protein